MSVLIATAISNGPVVPGWALPTCIGFTIFEALMDWRFRTGWKILRGRLAIRREMFDLYISYSYAAFPAIFGGLSISGLFLIYQIWPNATSVPFKTAIFTLDAMFVGSGGWSIKEFLSPSKSREPEWLRAYRHHGR
ncbi:MAG: hypothetical protein JWP74_3494 [Marmoricola sp.]|nr:hypothetical protein [Marmoricola sp.]